MCMANVGDVEVVICRRGEVVPVSRQFLVQSDQDECHRICKSDGIITEVYIYIEKLVQNVLFRFMKNRSPQF